jgi:hypothetical protein
MTPELLGKPVSLVDARSTPAHFRLVLALTVGGAYGPLRRVRA